MANIVTETTWHGNPRPIETYTTTVFDESVASPYYSDGRLVPVYTTYNTSVPLSSLVPGANIVTAGPALIVSGDVTGLWPVLDGLSIGITVTGGTDISLVSLNLSGRTLSPDEFAVSVANELNAVGAGEIQCGASGNVVNISALAGVTGLTITTWAVAP